SPDADESVGNHLRFDVELTRVVDVRVQTPTARRINEGGAPVLRGFFDACSMTVRHAFSDPVDVDGSALRRKDAHDKNYLTVRPRDHPTAGCGLLDAQ